MTVDIKRLRKEAVIPTHGSDYAAGYDLYACGDREKYEIQPRETIKISTGIAVAIPKGYFGAIFARSGIATKRGLRPANCVGVVDSDYRGEIIVALCNDTYDIQSVERGERIAQLVILPYLPIEFNEIENLDETARGAGGFGSTGTYCNA